MRIKLDENLPVLLAPSLRALGHNVHTTQEEGLAGESDSTLWKAGQDEGRFLITQDLDFSDIRKFAPGTHSGILLVRLRSPDRSALIARVEAVFANEDVVTWPGCFGVVTDRKVRVIRPSGNQ